jgi:hypothetical protein
VSEIRFLSKQNVRSVWQKEDADFTPWLAAPEPLTHLFEECGIEIQELDESTTIQTEVLIPGVGRRLDILVTLNDGTKIAIENQFNALDHDHLTRSLAYAVGLEVSTVIIVAEFHKSEFLNVAAYLNNAAASYEHGIKFFLVQLDVLSVSGGTEFYPNFKLVEGPDEWRGAIEEIQEGNPKAEVSALIYNFHEALLPHLRETTGLFQNVTPSKNTWKASGLGIGGYQICVNASRDTCNVQIWMHKGNSPDYNKIVYDVLFRHKAEIESAMTPYATDWRLQGAGIIEVRMEGFGYRSEPSDLRFQELAKIAGLMSEEAKKYLSEIKLAIENLS